MQVVVINGVLPEAEKEAYVRYITNQFPIGAIEKVILDVQGEHVDISYFVHRYRNMRKMGGYCIGEPEVWNTAKQAEFQDSVCHPVE